MKRIRVPLKGWWASSIAGPCAAPVVMRSSLIDVQFSINVGPGTLLIGVWGMASIVASPADRKASERKFYSRMALFLVFLVLLGFGPSFYLRGIVPSYPRPNP